jgi:hypothetical protein
MVNAFLRLVLDVFALGRKRSVSALQHLALGRRMTPQVQTNR